MIDFKELKNTKLIYKLRRIRRYLKIKFFYVSTIKNDFKAKLGYELNLINPTTFNEKLQWIKVYYRKRIMTICADKYGVRKIVKEKIGKEFLNEIYGVYESVEDIDLTELPNKFVFKSTHSSGHVFICTDKDKVNWKKEFNKMKSWLKENYYYIGGEWVYKNIKPRIICEKLLESNIIDYKMYCFNGKVKYTQVISNRVDDNFNTNYYDLNWNPIEVNRLDRKKSDNELPRPKNHMKMIKFSEILSEEFPFARIDFYEVEGHLYFGEITFFPVNGFIKFSSYEEDRKWGSYLDLPHVTESRQVL